MRIVGGTHRGRQLHRVMKDTTRETSDMVKVAVFNMLNNDCSGHVLDLFAGSGAYGIEAISRGSDNVYFVDHDKDAINCVRVNLKMIKEEAKTKLFLMPYERFINQLDDVKFDYVFLDPPYIMNIYQEVILKLDYHVSHDGLVICESEKKINLPEVIGSFVKIKDKHYGIKRITIYQKKGE